MKTLKLTSVTLCFLFVAVSMISSCKKSYTSSKTQDNQLAAQFMNATNNVTEADDNANEDFNLVIGYDKSAAGRGSKCFTVSYDPSPNVYPHTKTIDYGTGCTNAAGVTKKGKIMITYYDPISDAQGRYAETNYDNYYVNDIHVEGNIKVNKIKNGSDQTVFKYISNKTLTTSGGDIQDWNGNSDWTLIEGNNTDDLFDDVYEITGHATGKETLGGIESNNWQSDIDPDNVVIKPQSCTRRVKGGIIVSIHLKTNNGGSDLNEYLDFGDGSCDNIATLSINYGEPQEVTLPLRFWPLN